MKYLLSLLCLCFFVSCDKDDEKTEPTKKDLLTASVWVYDNGGVDTNKDGTPDLGFSVIGVPACMLDNKGTFKTDNTGINDEGATKCSASLPQQTSFNWAFTNNENNINITGSGLFGLGGDFKILTLTSTSLSLSKDTTIAPLGAVALVAILKH